MDDRKTKSIFEIIAGYFVNLFYNTTYAAAKTQAIMSSVPLSDIYRKLVVQYVSELEKDDTCYSKFVSGLHAYFKQHAVSYRSISFDKFMDMIVDQFVPVEYQVIQAVERAAVFKSAICGLASTYRNLILKQYITDIIDHHMKETNPRRQQDDLVKGLYSIRDKIFRSCMKYSSGEKKSKLINEDDINMINDMKLAIEEEKKRHLKLETDYEKVLVRNSDLNKQCEKAKATVKELLVRIDFITKENEHLKDKLEAAQRELAMSKTAIKPAVVSHDWDLLEDIKPKTVEVVPQSAILDLMEPSAAADDSDDESSTAESLSDVDSEESQKNSLGWLNQ